MQIDKEIQLDDEKVIRPLEEWIKQQIKDKAIPVFGLAVSGRESNLLTRIYCHEELKTVEPTVENSLFRVASVSKLFTFVSLLQLVERGKIQLTDPIVKFIPDFKPTVPNDMPEDTYQKITVFNLIRHTGGLIRESVEGSYFDEEEVELSRMVRSMNKSTLVSLPGVVFKYSNAGVSMAGYIIEMVSGVSFEEYIEQNVLLPIGITKSTFRNDDRNNQQTQGDQVRCAVGHMWKYWDELDKSLNVFTESNNRHLFCLNSAGGFCATLPEMCSFMRIFLNGGNGIISEETLRHMLTPQPLDVPIPANPTIIAPSSYSRGLGSEIDQIYGLLVARHGGQLNGFVSDFRVLPQLGIGIYCVATLDCAYSLVSQLVDYALQLIMLQSTPSPELPIDIVALQDAHAKTKSMLTIVSVPASMNVNGKYVHQSAGLNDNHRFKIIPSYNGKTYLRGISCNAIGWIPESPSLLATNDRISYGQTLSLSSTSDSITTNMGKYLLQQDDIASLEYVPYNRLPEVSLPPPDVPAYMHAVIGHYVVKDQLILVYEEDGVLMMCIEWFFIYSMRLISQSNDKVVLKTTPDCMYNDEIVIVYLDVASGRPLRLELSGIPFKYQRMGPIPGQTQEGISSPSVIQEILARSYSIPCPHPPAKHDLVDLARIPTLKIDVKYATTDNFAGVKFYKIAKAFLLLSAAKSLERAHQWLAQWGVGIVVFDSYRPWNVTWTMSEGVRPEFRGLYVADPAKGSVHNRGGAVDISLYNLSSGEIIPMSGEFDEMSIRSHRSYFGGTSRQRWFKKLLTIAMMNHDFIPYPQEWWHFDFNFQKMNMQAPVLNVAFEDL
eukprot:gene3787-4367_t